MSTTEIVQENGTTPTETLPTVFQLMPRVLAAISPVGKDGLNTQQNYRFRSVDGIYNAVHRALADVGVFYMQRILQRSVDERATKGGGINRFVTVEALYRFYGPAGDYVDLGPVWGEGSDVGDKATSKAQTAALKYALIHAFAIPLEGDDDADAHTPELVPVDPDQWARDHGWDDQAEHDTFRAVTVEVRNALHPDDRAAFAAWCQENDHAMNRANPRPEAEALRKQVEALRDTREASVEEPEDAAYVALQQRLAALLPKRRQRAVELASDALLCPVTAAVDPAEQESWSKLLDVVEAEQQAENPPFPEAS